jgi:hypothetical protein
MSASAENQTATPSGPRGAARIVDRESRNPWLRWMVHFGGPMGASLLFHALMIGLLSLSGFVVMTPKSPIDVGPYEAGVVEADPDLGGFDFSENELLDDKVEEDMSLDDLTQDLSTMTDIDTSDFDDASQGLGDDSEGIFGGRGDILGIGGGAGEAGTGGFGGGMGGGRRIGSRVGMWGVNVLANKVAFVIDFSGSIVVAEDDLVSELKRSVGRLNAGQTFNVYIFFERQNRVRTEQCMSGLMPATRQNKSKFFDWIARQKPMGSTEPLEAMRRALRAEPEAVLFLSDGFFEDSVVDEITRANRRVKARIYCLVFDEILLGQADGLPPRETDGVTRLKRLSRENGGETKIITGADLERR